MVVRTITITTVREALGHKSVYPVAKVKVIIESIPNLSDGVVRNDSL